MVGSRGSSPKGGKSVRRISRWTEAKQDACRTEFKRLCGIGNHRPDAVRNAMKAGRSLRKLMDDGQVVIVDIDDVQLERFRRRYAVPESLKAVMFAVATANKKPEPQTVRVLPRFRWVDLPAEKTTSAWHRKWGVESPEAQKLMRNSVNRKEQR
jgi:hypothetical protein